MAPKGVELIFGVRNDPEWGPVLLAGSGGVFAEAMRDVRLTPPDLSVPQIVQELDCLQCSALFKGFRDAQPLDVESVAQILMTLGKLLQLLSGDCRDRHQSRDRLCERGWRGRA